MGEVGQLAPGTKCDRYDIVRLIGAGGMGEVYQAMHEFTKKQVALKVLKLAHAAKEHHVEKMRAEAVVLCRIKHHNLVEVYDAGFADVQTSRGGTQSLIWMAMELCEGESLRERLMREGAMRPALALEWAAQIAEGVQAAHEAQVIHRDLKPENIFIMKAGDIRVLDFGTAKFDGMGHRPTTAQDRVGTIPYMSPEHLNGEALDGRSDIYALGFILYEMLAGRHPFSDGEGGFPPLDMLLPMALAAEPESLAGHVGEDVWAVVARSLHKDKNGRFASMKDAARAYRDLAKKYGTDASGVALRLSGSTASERMPLADASGRVSAVPAATFANMTPPPLASGITPEPVHGVTGGALAGMAFAAAALGAMVVVLMNRPADVAPTQLPEQAAQQTAEDTSGSKTAAPAPTVAPTVSAAPAASVSTATPSASVSVRPPSRPPRVRRPPRPPSGGVVPKTVPKTACKEIWCE